MKNTKQQYMLLLFSVRVNKVYSLQPYLYPPKTQNEILKKSKEPHDIICFDCRSPIVRSQSKMIHTPSKQKTIECSVQSTA